VTGRLKGLFAALVFAGSASAAPLSAATPEKLDIPTFSVVLTDSAGTPRETFRRSSPPYFDISFALALSASKRYATKITLVHITGGSGTESVLYEGSLEEGFYRFLVPAPLVLGDVSARIILKTRVFPKKFTGDSYYVYRIWEGTYSVGH
jgi:hypothetical protein